MEAGTEMSVEGALRYMGEQFGRLEKAVERGFADHNARLAALEEAQIRADEREKVRRQEAEARERLLREQASQAEAQRNYRFSRWQLAVFALGSGGGVAAIIDCFTRLAGH